MFQAKITEERAMTRDQTKTLRARARAYAQIGLPYEIAVYLIAGYMRDNGISINDTNLEAVFLA